MSHTILLVDADESTTAFLADQLAADGYHAVVARTLPALFALADAVAPNVVVLGDLAERRHALALLDDVRAGARPFDPDVLVLVLSAHAEGLDVLRAFHHGATTWWPSRSATRSCAPASARSCAAGARVAARSCVSATSRSTPAHARSGWREPIALTQREFTLLVRLAAEPERVLTKAALTTELWGYPAECSTRTLGSHVARVRHTLGAHGGRSWVINVWGVGYALRDARSLDQEGAA